MDTPATLRKMHVCIFCVLNFLLISTIANAQVGSIKGRITTSDGQAASFVNVALKGAGKGTTTNEEGSYLIKNIKAGEYTLITSFVGVQTQEKQITVLAGETVTIDFVLSETAHQLSEVVVTGRKTLNEQAVKVGKIATGLWTCRRV